MAKGIAYDEEVVEKCLHAMDQGVPLAQISIVEGVALPTLYTWRIRRTRSERTSHDELARLRAENEALKARVLWLLTTLGLSELP